MKLTFYYIGTFYIITFKWIKLKNIISVGIKFKNAPLELWLLASTDVLRLDGQCNVFLKGMTKTFLSVGMSVGWGGCLWDVWGRLTIQSVYDSSFLVIMNIWFYHH